VYEEFEQAHKKFNGDLKAMNNHFPKCVNAIIACYSGRCGKLCRQHSLVPVYKTARNGIFLA